MDVDQIAPLFIGAVFVCVAAVMARGFIKHGGFRGMMFGAGIRKTIGEVEGAGRSMIKTVVKVHVLDAAPDKAIGIEFVAKSIASYQMVPLSLSSSEARKLIAHLQAAVDPR